MSVLLRPEITPDKASMLTLVMALSVAEGIGQCMAQSECPALQIKWPNDIIINGKKLAGILTEMSPDGLYQPCDYRCGDQCEYAGRPGRNRSDSDFPENRVRTYGKRAPLIAAVMERLEENYEIFLKTGLVRSDDRYSALLVNRDREVQILGAKETYRAHAIGIDRTGELIVRRKTEPWKRYMQEKYPCGVCMGMCKQV